MKKEALYDLVDAGNFTTAIEHLQGMSKRDAESQLDYATPEKFGGMNSLMYAAWQGADMSTIRCFVNHSRSSSSTAPRYIDEGNADGKTAAMLAAKNGRPSTLDALLTSWCQSEGLSCYSRSENESEGV